MVRGKEAEDGGEEIKYFMMTCCLKKKKRKERNGWKQVWRGVDDVFNGNERGKDGRDTLICPV